MVAPRKKTSGFTSKPVESTEEMKEVEEFIEDTTFEILTEVSKEEKTTTSPELAPFVVESITPTEDLGPRFVEKVEEPPKAVTPEASASSVKAVVHPPKRHPRNVPRFSRTRKA